MDFLNAGIPLGRLAGIEVRLHITFLIYALARATSYGNLAFGLVFVIGLYGCILLHEFGHALAARWCDGEATEILLWPLGGLAMVRPAWNPTAHLITTVAGPFVTLVLWLVFWAITASYTAMAYLPLPVSRFLLEMRFLNGWLLLFNLIPAFPMDGGRILRDTLWHWMRAETATAIAVWVSRAIALLGIILAAGTRDWMLFLLALFILWQAASEQQIVAFEAGGTYAFSVRERLRRGRRQRAFFHGVQQRAKVEEFAAFHRCAVCGRTERDDPTLDFRACSECSDGQEYCLEHLPSHQHR